jgi:hypothetical protein
MLQKQMLFFVCLLYVILACPESFLAFKEGFPTSGNDKVIIGIRIHVIPSPSLTVIPSGARNLVFALRINSASNLFLGDKIATSLRSS